MSTKTVSDVAPVPGADVKEGDRILTERRMWSSPITHFTDLPDDYWGTRLYGWTRVAFTGDIPLRPIGPADVIAVRIRDIEDGGA